MIHNGRVTINLIRRPFQVTEVSLDPRCQPTFIRHNVYAGNAYTAVLTVLYGYRQAYQVQGSEEPRLFLCEDEADHLGNVFSWEEIVIPRLPSLIIVHSGNGGWARMYCPPDLAQPLPSQLLGRPIYRLAGNEYHPMGPMR